VIRLLWPEETCAVCRSVVWQVKRQRQMTRVTECTDNVCLCINLLCFIGVFAALWHPNLYRTAGGKLISELYYLLWQFASCNDIPLFYLKLMHDSFMAWDIQNKEYIEISFIMKINNGFYPSYIETQVKASGFFLRLGRLFWFQLVCYMRVSFHNESYITIVSKCFTCSC
jgi:hypothetical protein